MSEKVTFTALLFKVMHYNIVLLHKKKLMALLLMENNALYAPFTSASALTPDFSQHGTGELSVSKWKNKVTCIAYLKK